MRLALALARGLTLRHAALAGLATALAGVAVVVAAEWRIERATRGRLYTSIDALPAGAPTLAIVPGARVFADGTPSHALADRLHAALELHRAGRVTKILVSGDHGTAANDEVNAMRAWLLARGVPSTAIYLDHAGLRTLDTMARAARVFGARRAIVCTQRFHLARSVYLARSFGLDALGLVADRRELTRRFYNTGRERLARVKAWLDVRVLGTGPRHLGPPIPIDGPASLTHDRDSRA